MFESVTHCFFISFYLSCLLSFLVASCDLFITFPLPFSPAPPPFPCPFLSYYRLQRSWTTLTLRPKTLMFAAGPVCRQRMTSSLLARAHGWVVCHSLLDSYIPMPGILASCVVHIQRSALIHQGFVVRICVIHNKFTFKLCSQWRCSIWCWHHAWHKNVGRMVESSRKFRSPA